MAKLLLVDDDIDAGDILADILSEEGHDVRVARNGQEGLAALRTRLPNLILLDVEMPVLSGPGMANQMFIHNCGLEEIPIVLLSGILELAHVAATARIPYFLAKPYSLDALLRLIAQVLVEVPPKGTASGEGARSP